MKKVMLICNAGMSTGMLAKKMEDAGKGSVIVEAYGEAEYMEHLNGVNVILVGPQIRYLIDDIQKTTTVPVLGINPMRYGIMDGKGVLADIANYLKEE